MNNQSIYCALANQQAQKTDFLLQTTTTETWEALTRIDNYTIIWVQSGTLCVYYERLHFKLKNGDIFFAAPTSVFSVEQQDASVVLLTFSTDFFCLDRHLAQIGCKGILFDNQSDAPFMPLPEENKAELWEMIEKMTTEFDPQNEMVDADTVATYLKLFLKKATRIKTDNQHNGITCIWQSENPTIAQFKTLVECQFRYEKSPSYYAKSLFQSGKNLTRLVKTHLHTSPSKLITERVVTEAKEELYNTPKSIKQIALELGYDDPYYFSRLFKKTTHQSPENFRQSVGR